MTKAPEATPLESGRPAEREMSGGQKHLYRLALTEGQYAGVRIEQRGVDVIARLFGPGEKLIAEFDLEIRPHGTELVEVAAPAAHDYRLEVEAKLKEAPAGRYGIAVAELRPATEQDRSLHEARVLLAESLGLSRAGKFKEALPPAERALGIREQVLGPEHPAVAQLLNRMGILDSSLGNVARAEALFRRAADIFEKRSGPDDLNLTDALNNLSVLHRNRGEFVEAEAILRRVLAAREKALGPEHPSVAVTLNNLGVLYRRRGDNARAERMYERSLEIRERALGADHPDLANVLMNLAALNYYKGDYATALALDRRALEIREKHLGPEHPLVADDLGNLALVYADAGEPEKAEPLYQRALAIYEKRFGRDHTQSRSTLHNLAKLYTQRGDYAQAKSFFRRALQVAEKDSESDPASVALTLHSLGGLHTLEGDYARAETVLRRALEIREKVLGGEHQDVGRTCGALARMYAMKGDAAQALAFQARANAINEKNIALNLALGSEHQKLSYMTLMSEELNQTIALHAGMARGDAAAREQAVTAVLQRKGRVLDAMADSLAALRRRLDAQDQDLLDRLNDANARLAELTLGGPRRTALAEHQKQLAAAEQQKRKLEAEMSRLSEGFYESPRPVTLAATRASIPDGAALIEFAVYRPLGAKGEGGKRDLGEPRYVAYVIRRQGEVGWAELGAGTEVDGAITALRQALSDPTRADARQLARAADEKVMRPLRPLIGDATHLLISPDGGLNLIPFEALADERGRHLIERYSFTYLTSGRDLLRLRAARGGGGQSLIVANPSFGEPAEGQMARAGGAVRAASRGVRHRSVTAARSLDEVYFAPLGGSAQEARSIRKLFPEADLLTGARATESALKRVAAPRVLHVATHGFFLQDAEATAAGDAQVATRAVVTGARIENPLLRSGLALAGANARRGAGGDGILTALEASGLNLWGTRLVVLSACDTGLGEVRNGEGVYGLRRAFALAGAESLVMSLWPVSDYATRRLMTDYYRNLKRGLGRGAALRRVQLDLLARDRQLHPFYWANFIQSGEWANLDGRR